jgi:hypothetical protein
VSDDHRPIFWMVCVGTPLRCRAMAPPARREWLDMLDGQMLYRCRPRALTVDLSSVLMSALVTWRPVGCVGVKYVPIITLESIL